MQKPRSISKIYQLISTDITNNRVGIGSTIPTTTLDVAGITTIGIANTYTTISSPGSISGTTDFATSVTVGSKSITGNLTADSFTGTGTDIKGAGIMGMATIVHRTSYDTDGGNATKDIFQERPLTNIIDDEEDIVDTLSGNEFSLRTGTYILDWSLQGYRVRGLTTRLYNVTDDEVVANQSCAHNYLWDSGSKTVPRARGQTAKFSVTGSTETFRIEQVSEDGYNTYGLGYSHDHSALGYNYYCVVYIYKCG